MSYTVAALAKTGGGALSSGRDTPKEALKRAKELQAEGWDVTITDTDKGRAYSIDQFAAAHGNP